MNDAGRFRRSRADDRSYTPAIELTHPGGEPMCFVLPQDAEALVKELAETWRAGAWRDLVVRTVVECKDESVDIG